MANAITSIAKAILDRIDPAAHLQMEYDGDLSAIATILRTSRYTVQRETDTRPRIVVATACWFRSNLDLDPAELEAILDLEPGQTTEIGGGAAPIVTVTRAY